MTTTVASVLTRVRTLLQDTGSDRWSDSELVGYLNDAQRTLVVARPDAGAVTQTVATVQGARQTIPTDSMVLIDVPRNGTGRKRAIRKAELQVLDAVARDWQSGAEAVEFVNFMHDMREPNVFYLYPPSKATGGSVEITTSKYPVAATIGGDITVADQWVTPIGDYVLAQAYAKDAEFGGNAALSAAYLAAFNNALGVQLQAASAVSIKS